MYTKKQYSEPNVFSFSNFKTIIGIILSIVVFVFALIVIMVKTNLSLLGLTLLIPDDEDTSLALQENSLVFMREIDKNSLPPRGELVTFNNEGKEVLVRVIRSEENDEQILYYVTGGGFVEHMIDSTYLQRQGSFLIPNFGKFVSFLVTPAGLITCLGFPLIIILILLLTYFMNMPKKNGDHTFSQVDNQNYFGTATNTNKKQRGKKGKNEYHDPYENGYNQNIPQPQQSQQPHPQAPWLTQEQVGYEQQNQGYQQQQQPMQQQQQQQPIQQPVQPQQDYGQQGYQQNNVAEQQNQPNKPRPTIESILADVTGNNYNFDEDYELDYDHIENEETMPLSYTKPETVDTSEESNSLIVTREFFIAELQPEEVTKAHEYSRGVGFQANLNDFEKNNFNIDGIDVNVDSNNIQLAITEDNNSDIFITVTEEFTNVVVNKENLETSFALFKDDEDEKNKVIIRKKQLG